MHTLILLPILLLTLSPIWIKSQKMIRIQLYTLTVALIFAMVALTPRPAAQSAPFQKVSPSTIAFFSCSQAISKVKFCLGPPNYREYSCVCRNENAFATLAHCYQTGYPEEIDSFMDQCNQKYNTSLNREKFNSALERYYDTAKDVSEAQSLNSGQIVDFPVKLSHSEIALYQAAYDQFLGNYNRSIDYGWYLVAFWTCIFGLAAVGNWTKVLFPKVMNYSTGTMSRWTRSKVTLPALYGKERTSEKKFGYFLDFLPPTRAESLIIGAFSLLVLKLSFHKIHFVPGDPVFGNPLSMYMRCYAVRTGILASYLLPLSVLFAGRNNVLQWITRWEYSTFVMFHRWISRVMVLLIVVHSVGYCRHILVPIKDIDGYLLFGVLGTVAGVLILVQGLLVLRRKWYEAFLAMHILLAAAYLVGAWLHVDSLDFLWYFYVSACLWVFDRVIRVQRLCVFGFPRAKIQLYEDDTLKFRVPIPSGFAAEGGGHCFVHFLHWSSFWQSHPFTYTIVDGHIVFYVKVKKGLTAQLKTYLEEHPTKAAYMRVAVEGSYGEATPAEKYDSSVFIAGGNGIPGIYAEAVAVARKNNGLRRVKLIWVVREYTSILWFYEELELLSKLEIDAEIYVTRPENRFPAVSDKLALLENTYTHNNYNSMGSSEDAVHKLEGDLRHVTFHNGRPNMGKIVESHSTTSPGSTCFVTCGHPVMVDEIRYEVAQRVAVSERRVDYFEQLQVWA